MLCLKNRVPTMSIHWKVQTEFPFTRVFVLGIILFFLGLASMVIAVIAFVTESWGHYVGTGMWGGALILGAGLMAIFVSHLKSLASVKAFLICSVIGVFASLTMLILSAGGLTVSSGFYGRVDRSQYNKRTSNLIHASLLVISAFCLSGNVLAVIVSCKYLFFEKNEKPPKHRRRHRTPSSGITSRTGNALRGGSSNGGSARSTNSRTVLLHVSHGSSRRHSDNLDVNSNNRVTLEYRARSHRRSASDQPQSHSHSRRHRPSSHESAPVSQSSNMFSSNAGRFYQEKRTHFRSRCDESERMNIQPVRQIPLQNASSSSRMQVRLSNSPFSSMPHKIRLPTEFNEEELPPYEPAERPPRVVVGASSSGESPGESGDESDTENSSSSDGHSYNTSPLCPDGVESVPMVDLGRHHRNHDSQHVPRVESNVPDLLQREDQTVNRFSNQISVTVSAAKPSSQPVGSIVVRQNSKHTSQPVMSYVNCIPSSSQIGEYERLLSVSPEVRAITGASPEPRVQEDLHIPHVTEENFYENGPCYANILHAGSNKSDKGKSIRITKETRGTEHNQEMPVTESMASQGLGAARTAPIHVITASHPSPVISPSSIVHSPRSSFGSSHSAFRPVGASALSPHTTHSICSPTPHSPFSHVSDSRENSPFSSPRRVAINIPDAEVLAIEREKYKQQGARPKSVKTNELSVSEGREKDIANMSWKNIPLPLSYNHSECVSNDDDKLPSKNIPFADENDKEKPPDPVSVMPTTTQSSEPGVGSGENVPRRVVPKSLSSHEVTSSRASEFVSVAESIISHSPPIAMKSVSQPLTCPQSSTQPSSKSSIVSSRSHQPQTFSAFSSHWPNHRMGGNQSLLQSRREALQNTHLTSRTLAGVNSASASQPVSVPVLPQSQIHGQTRPHSQEEQVFRGATHQAMGTGSQSHPLSLNGYLVSENGSSSRRDGSDQGGIEHSNQQLSCAAVGGVNHVTDRLNNPDGRVSIGSANHLSSRQNNSAILANQQPFRQVDPVDHHPNRQNNGPVLANQQAVRQNPFLLHHYPIQPQQPRLGVQLHQRRQQQHQLQQNVELQQQQLQQGNQQNPQPAPQQARNGRPLFSVLL